MADATEKMRMAMHDWDLSALRADNDLRAYIHAQQKPVGIPSSATPSAIPFRCIVAVTHNPAVYAVGGVPICTSGEATERVCAQPVRTSLR